MGGVLQICNLGLARIGVRSSGFIQTLGDNTENAQVCNQLFQTILETALGLYPWQWAKGQAQLAAMVPPGYQGDWVSTTTYQLNQWVTVPGISQNPAAVDALGNMVGGSITEPTLYFQSLVNNNTGNSPTATGTQFWSAATAYTRQGWNWMYALPADCLVVRHIFDGVRTPYADQKSPFELQASDDGSTPVLLTDMPNAWLIYTRRLEPPALNNFDPLFTDAMGWAMAVELSSSLRVELDQATRKGLEDRARRAFEVACAKSLNESSEYEPTSELIAARGDGLWAYPYGSPTFGSPFPAWWPY